MVSEGRNYVLVLSRPPPSRGGGDRGGGEQPPFCSLISSVRWNRLGEKLAGGHAAGVMGEGAPVNLGFLGPVLSTTPRCL